jgi:hypothetical protein
VAGLAHRHPMHGSWLTPASGAMGKADPKSERDVAGQARVRIKIQRGCGVCCKKAMSFADWRARQLDPQPRPGVKSKSSLCPAPVFGTLDDL